jgi:TfoX/Sxy family transcriptional regulator of competence genes
VAFDEGLAERVRDVIGDDPSVSERKMFGGLCFMTNGNMCVGIVGDDLMVRVGPEAWEEALSRPHAREMDFTGKSMTGMVYVSAEGVAEDDDLSEWVKRGVEFADSLPPKR